MKNSIFFITLALVAASCASLGKYKDTTEVSDSLYGNVGTSDVEVSLGELQWQDVFTDPCLKNLIDTALVRNISLKVAGEHICQAEAQLTAAKLAYIPTLGITPTFTKSVSGDKFGNSAYDYNLNASASWQLDIFRMINNQKSAQVTVEQMEDYRQAVHSQLVAGVANAYFTILMLDSQLETSISIQKTWEQSLEIAKALKEAGLADQVAVSQYEANLENIKITVKNLENQIVLAENAMCTLLSCEPGREIVRGRLADQAIPDKLAPGVPVKMLALRPDVRAAQKEMEIAHYMTRGALLNFFPTLSINGSIGLVNPATGAISPMTQLAAVGAGIVAPILSAGKNKAALAAAQSNQREVKLNFENTLLNAGVEVNDAYNNYYTFDRLVENYNSLVSSLEQACKDTEYLMRNSLDKTYLDVLFAYSNYFEAELGAIANQAQKMQALVSMYTALGGGSI